MQFYQEEKKDNNLECQLSRKIYELKKYKNDFDIVFLCIGTDKITGDCFGPLVGSKIEEFLKKNNIIDIFVYGTLNENANYSNIQEILNHIAKKHINPYIIVVDAALSKKENVGKIYIQEGKTILGKGLNKNKIEIGDFSIRGIVGRDYKISNYNFYILQNISLSIVMKLANKVAESIVEVIKYA